MQNRSYKFRVWDRNKKEMIYFDFHTLQSLNDLEDISYYEIMQYTGLKDKNGREIYEGDVVAEYLSDSEDEYYSYHGVVEYFSPEFCLKTKSDTCIKLVNTGSNLEVIGNIYESPKILTIKYMSEMGDFYRELKKRKRKQQEKYEQQISPILHELINHPMCKRVGDHWRIDGIWDFWYTGTVRNIKTGDNISIYTLAKKYKLTNK